MTAEQKAALPRYLVIALVSAIFGAGGAAALGKITRDDVVEMRGELRVLEGRFDRHDAEAQTWIRRLQRDEDARTRATPKWSQ